MAEAVKKMSGMQETETSEKERICKSGIPLAMARAGEQMTVTSIRGKDETRRFLNNLGFVEDAEVTVVTELGGNLIVNVKGARVAISRSMASRILTA